MQKRNKKLLKNGPVGLNEDLFYNFELKHTFHGIDLWVDGCERDRIKKHSGFTFTMSSRGDVIVMTALYSLVIV